MRRSVIGEEERSALDGVWREANRPFEENDFCGPGVGPTFIIERPQSRVFLSAVHAVKHYRAPGHLKDGDANTGGLVLGVTKFSGVGSAVVLRTTMDRDANSSDEHPIKDALGPLLGPGKILMDVHGMGNQHGIDVVIGVGRLGRPDSPLVETVRGVFEAHDLRVGDGAALGLNAERPVTMTSWAQTLGAEAVQVELARSVRSFRADPNRRRAVGGALLEIARILDHTNPAREVVSG